jgi:hypothetical protein
MDDPDYEIAVLATMSECISRLVKASSRTDDEHMKAITSTAASICMNLMLSTQRRPADVHSINGETMQ